MRFSARTVAIVAVLLVPLAGTATAQAKVSCGDVLTATTKLTRDLACPNAGLTLAAPGITLDLNGHTIRGTGAGVGITLEQDATVRDGRVVGFEVGVANGDAGVAATVSRLAVLRNDSGLSFFRSELHLSWSDVSHNASVGVAVNSGRATTLIANRIAGNEGNGVTSNSEPGTYRHNVVAGNGGNGIEVRDATSSFVENAFIRNARHGLTVTDVYGIFFPYSIARNVATLNGGLGIAFSGIPVSPDGAQRVDGGGNVARLNGDARQCVNLEC